MQLHLATTNNQRPLITLSGLEVLNIYAVELENISKTFPGGVEANKDITLRIERGEVHGLLGENGAGKSTAMNILYGLLSPTSGTIKINGEEVSLQSPEDAIFRGVGMVHQHFKLIQPLTVTENVMMGYESPGKTINKPVRLATIIFSLFSIFLFYHFLGLINGTIVTIFFALAIVASYKSFEIITFLIKKLSDFEVRIRILDAVRKSIVESLATIRYMILNFIPLGFDEAAEKIRKIADDNGLIIDPNAKILDLSVGLQQRVEIIKALYRNAEILILDEPTSVLTPQEVDELFITLNTFRESGKTIILITHKLREPMALCDRITVLRDGALVGTVRREETSPEELAKMMVGRPVVFRVEKGPSSPGDIVMSVEDIYVDDVRGLPAVKGVSFDLRAGEIFGLAGVQGNGQTELIEVLTGLVKPKSGAIIIQGYNVAGKSPRKVREAGLAHIPEDRHKRGLVLQFTIEENLALGNHYREPFSSKKAGFKGFLNQNYIRSNAKTLVDDYSVKIGRVFDPANTLSGGNQQKIVVARELSSNPIVLVAAQPTRGLDVGATEYIHNVLVALRDSGVGVLLISAELDEIQSLSDRIGVIYNGELVAIRDPETTTAEELGLLMAGQNNSQEVTV
ncbi:ABC transporter ATP-binding protein [Candidatus Thorarchaeota archaeon]|nr:MAG: ABC transporter ATP-binding protein [Candidatus Thorarchaeota archaeon]